MEYMGATLRFKLMSLILSLNFIMLKKIYVSIKNESDFNISFSPDSFTSGAIFMI